MIPEDELDMTLDASPLAVSMVHDRMGGGKTDEKDTLGTDDDHIVERTESVRSDDAEWPTGSNVLKGGGADSEFA